MIGILLLSTAIAEVVVAYTVPEHHIAGQPYTLDLQIFNDGESAESIQNLRTDRWAITFTVNQNQQLYTANSTKPSGDSVSMITLQPRGLQELRFEVPNSAAWKTGTLQLQIKTPFSSEPYRQDIVVHPHTIEDFAVQDVAANAFVRPEEILWSHQSILFVNPQQPRFVSAIPSGSTFGTSLHIGPSRHIHWISGQKIYVLPIVGERTSEQIRTTIPWPNGETMGPSFTDGIGRYMTPIWVPNSSEQGTLYMLILNRQGHPSFRKIFSGTKPEECIGALSQSGIPIIGLRSQNGAWLLALTEVGNPKVDLLPPKTLSVHREDIQSKSIDFSFGISESQGLFVGLLSQTTSSSTEKTLKEPQQPTLTIRQYSLQGQELRAIPLDNVQLGSDTQLLWFDDAPYISTQNGKTLFFWKDTQVIWKSKDRTPHAIRIQGDGVHLWSIEDGRLSVDRIVDAPKLSVP